MNRFKQVSTPLRARSGKKLAGFTVLTTLLVGFIVFSAVIILKSYSMLKLMDQYILEVPKIVEAREKELNTRSRVFREDVLARGELGARVYREERGLGVAERLERVRSTVAAESASLIRGGAVLHTTGSLILKDAFDAQILALSPRTPVFGDYPIPAEEGEGGEKKLGRAFVLIPVDEEPEGGLVLEFDCSVFQEVNHSLVNWPAIVERMLSGMNAYAFVQVGQSEPIGYPLEGFSEEERTRMFGEVRRIFQRSSRALRGGGKTTYHLFILGHQPAVAVCLACPKWNADVLMAVSLKEFISTGVYSAATLSLFIVFQLILFSLYVLKRCRQKEEELDWETFRRELGNVTRPGRLCLLAAVGGFSFMLLTLENHATLASTAATKRLALEFEIQWHQDQQETIRTSYTDIYRTRAQALARFLMDHREYQTHRDLQAFSDVIRADYLMLFDTEGKERVSSNSYTGFTVGGADATLPEEFRAVLYGYPSMVVGPRPDPYTGRQQVGAAILLTKDDGQADGFLLAVFGAADLNAELAGESLQNTVNSFAVVRGCQAAVVNKEDGLFLAHTDADKIDLEAKHYMGEEVYLDDYEGFTKYEGYDVYVSGVTYQGKSLLFLAPVRSDDREDWFYGLMMVVLLGIIAFLFCPRASVLCAQAMEEAMEESREGDYAELDRKNPLFIFAEGEILFFTLLAGIALFAALTMAWPAFAFVFGGMWSRGFHLFSIWAALFLLAVTLGVFYLIRKALKGAEQQANPWARTMLKLADSFVAYATGIFLVVVILYMFGVNTAALLASAGVVSIAVGMGSQSMVSDIVAGMFLTMEDSIHMGDVVDIGGWKGRVTDMGIRTTKITDDSQNVMILNNSRISNVVNMSRSKTACVLELEMERKGVAMAETEKILGEAVAEASREMPELFGSLGVEGIHNITRESFTARLTYSCAEVEREAVTKRLQEFLEEQVRQRMEQATAGKA